MSNNLMVFDIISIIIFLYLFYKTIIAYNEFEKFKDSVSYSNRSGFYWVDIKNKKDTSNIIFTYLQLKKKSEALFCITALLFFMIIIVNGGLEKQILK